jgi:HK97 gp10 family phage protein
MITGLFTFNLVALDHLLNAADGPVGLELDRLGAEVEMRAKQLCPVSNLYEDIPGNLRDSITSRTGTATGAGSLFAGEPVVYVGTDVTYAPYVEFGTFKMAAEPFLRPALYSVKI